MKKQTAVEWLVEYIHSEQYQKAFGQTYISIELVEQAKAMEHEQMLKLISFIRMHNKMGKSADDLLKEFETHKVDEQ